MAKGLIRVFSSNFIRFSLSGIFPEKSAQNKQKPNTQAHIRIKKQNLLTSCKKRQNQTKVTSKSHDLAVSKAKVAYSYAARAFASQISL